MTYEYDPERALWKPNRRFFLFGLAAGIIAPTLPSLEPMQEMAMFTETWTSIPGLFKYIVETRVNGILTSTRTVPAARAPFLAAANVSKAVRYSA